MGIVSPGFIGRRRGGSELPPGQYLTGTSRCCRPGRRRTSRPTHWEFTVTTETGQQHRWDWAALHGAAGRGRHRRPPLRHQVVEAAAPTGAASRSTRCSRTSRPTPDFALVHSYGGYTTNLPLDDLLDGQAWIAYEYDGEPLDPEHGGPARLLVPHLYLWKSAKWVTRHRAVRHEDARLLGDRRLPQLRRPMARTAVLGRLTWQVGHGRRRPTRRRATARTLRARRAGWPGHLAGQHVDVRLTARTATRAHAVVLDRLGADRRRRSSSPSSEVPDGEVSPYLVDVAAGRRPARDARTGRRLVRLAARAGRRRCC